MASFPNSPKADMCGGTAMECGEIPAVGLPWLPVIEFMPKPAGWKKEFCALVGNKGKWEAVISEVLALVFAIGRGCVLNMPPKNGVSAWCGRAAGGDML